MSYPAPQGQPAPEQTYPPQDSYGQAQPPPGGYPVLPPQQQGYPPPQESQPSPQQQHDPAASIATGMESMSIKPRAGTTALLSMFAEANIILLESRASGKSLQINNGDVEGLGDQDKQAQFIVHVRRPGVVALQNVSSSDSWLGIYEGKLVGTASGGPYCEFLVGEIDGKLISLESTMYPGQFVGVLPDGSPKSPSEESGIAGDDERFVPVLISESSAAPANPPPSSLPPAAAQPPPYDPQQYSQPPYSAAAVPAAVGVGVGVAVGAASSGPYPPQGPGYPPQGPGYPPQGGGYPPQGTGYPPQGGAYPPPGGYPPQAQMQRQGPPPPQGPQLPMGFNIMDSFQQGNEVQLICRGNGYPVHAHQGKVTAKGSLDNPDATWLVIIPPGAPQGYIMLRNKVWQGMYLAIQKAGGVGPGKGRKFCHFRVRVQPDNYCLFESVETPGFFLNFVPNGAGGNIRTRSNQDSTAQFFIRVVKQVGNFSQQIMTPFGRPSMANNLRSGFIVQLYLKASSMYLGINKNGLIYYTTKDNDPLTFLEVVDRGMGIVSFNLRTHAARNFFRLKMENNALKGKGVSDLNADFRIKDLPDGTVCFESVTCPGCFIGISVANGQQTNLNIQLLQVHRTGRTENVSKIPLN